MSAKISDLQERQIVNIADGKCLGNVKDIELNVLDGTVQALVLPGVTGFLGLLQNQGEVLIPWRKVVRIGVDVVLVNVPELVDDGMGKRRRRRREEAAWQQEVEQYQQELEQKRIVVLPPQSEPYGYGEIPQGYEPPVYREP